MHRIPPGDYMRTGRPSRCRATRSADVKCGQSGVCLPRSSLLDNDQPVILVVLAADLGGTGWTVTTTLAAVAASISLVTLIVTTYFTGRRERVKWAREELAKAFYDFVDASYAASQAVHQHQKALWAGAEPVDIQTAASEAKSQLLAVRHAQTKIRLLAPARTVERANDVRFRLRDLNDSTHPEISEAEHERLRTVVAESRQRLIESAKRDMALPR